jgi:hypothetical protein
LLNINFNIMAWIWKVKERVKIVTIAIVFNFITNIIFIKLFEYWWIWWVNWAAVATWFWWILIWIMSEKELWETYKTKFEYWILWKNIFTMWLIWTFSYFYLLPVFSWLGRLNSLFYMLIFTICYFSLFTIVNLKEFMLFLWEIKKFRKKS